MLILITIDGGLLAAYLLATLVLIYLVHQIPRWPITDPPDWGTVTDVRISTVEYGWLDVWRIEPPGPSRGIERGAAAMTVKKGQIVELEVSDMAFGGRGLARVEGLAVFVEQAVPLDRALVRIIRKKKNFAEARMEKILQPSPYRVRPPCPYSGHCGGCKWQFVDYADQGEPRAMT